ncbi:MAG: hypothetical protein O3C49_10730 [Proteobacteria bacterium]|nr:hypothetical protein [Pseudomonadota bacterium]MDA1323140.1 hypothetical protein [Pseudomonadota bacterium]
MKFLLFNVAVAAALVFLFTADRGEVQKIAGQVHDAAGDMKSYANKALTAGQSMFGRETEKAGRKTGPTLVTAPSLPVTQPVTQPVTPATVTRPEPLAEPSRSRQLASDLQALPETGSATSRKSVPTIIERAPQVLEPDVARRRREVLDGLDAAPAAPALKEGTRLMTGAERRKELLSLAEEMELLYARSINQ